MDGLPLSVDWMALTLQLNSPVRSAPDGHRWAYYSATNVWASRWCMFNEYGEKVFTLLFQPRQSIIRSDRALLEIANEWLYHGIGISGCLGLLSQCCGFTVLGISRADLACDFVPDDRQADIIRGLYRQQYYVGGKQNGNGWWSLNGSRVPNPMWTGWCPHDMNWGHKTSDVKWKLYYKTKELKDEAHGFGYSKPYIVDLWRECGMDESNVWRLEVSLKHCNNFDFKGDPLTLHAFTHDTVDIFKSLYNSRFQVRENQGHKDRTNDRVVEFLPIGRLHGAFKVHRDEHEVAHNSCLTLLRHLITDVQTEEVLLNDTVREAVLSSLESILTINHLGSYFHTIVGDSFDSWREFLRVKAYYYGEENLAHSEDTGEKMETAMIEAGMVEVHEEPKFIPLGATSSMSPQRSATQQTAIDFGHLLP